eukprot:TRINITY_DN22983_c0_g1_i1.p1 TRINITY_DN22983_c0_g1~~TRINITY_DN22983_c0_g1_i1.p1  ORF type:complete len:682 (+),score=162.83 TRINITY_DN22983_c0_g1_i1:51-2096(+)
MAIPVPPWARPQHQPPPRPHARRAIPLRGTSPPSFPRAPDPPPLSKSTNTRCGCRPTKHAEGEAWSGLRNRLRQLTVTAAKRRDVAAAYSAKRPARSARRRVPSPREPSPAPAATSPCSALTLAHCRPLTRAVSPPTSPPPPSAAQPAIAASDVAALERKLECAVGDACWLQAQLKPPLAELDAAAQVAASLQGTSGVLPVQPPTMSSAVSHLLQRLEELWSEKEAAGVGFLEEWAANLRWAEARAGPLPRMLAAFNAVESSRDTWEHQLLGAELLALKLLRMTAADIDSMCGYPAEPPATSPVRTRNGCVATELHAAIAQAAADVGGGLWPHGDCWRVLRRWAQTVAVLLCLPPKLVREYSGSKTLSVVSACRPEQAAELMLLGTGNSLFVAGPVIANASAGERKRAAQEALARGPACVIEIRGARYGVPLPGTDGVLVPLLATLRLERDAATDGRTVHLRCSCRRPHSIATHSHFARRVRRRAEEGEARLRRAARAAAAAQSARLERHYLRQVQREQRREEEKQRQRERLAARRRREEEEAAAQRLRAAAASAGWSAGYELRASCDGLRSVTGLQLLSGGRPVPADDPPSPSSDDPPGAKVCRVPPGTSVSHCVVRLLRVDGRGSATATVVLEGRRDPSEAFSSLCAASGVDEVTFDLTGQQNLPAPHRSPEPPAPGHH